MATHKDYSDLKPYERANRWIAPIPRNEDNYCPGLYFWGSLDEEWQMYENSYEYKIDRFLCTDYSIAISLVYQGYAIIDTFDEENKQVYLKMKRIY